MLKNVSAVICMLFFVNAVAFVVPSQVSAAAKSDASAGTGLSQKEEQALYKEELAALVKKYNAATEANKPAVRTEVTNLISKQTDREIERKKERIAKIEKEIADINSDRENYVNKKVDKALKAKKKKKK